MHRRTFRTFRAAFAGFSPREAALALAFTSSAPAWFPGLSVCATAFGSGALAGHAAHSAFVSTMSLAAMFVALAVLFVCLVKTAYARMPLGLLRVAGVAYAASYLALAAISWFPGAPEALITPVAVLLGLSGATVFCSLVLRLRWRDCRTAFAGTLAFLGAGYAFNAVLYLANVPHLHACAACAAACLGALGVAFSPALDSTPASATSGAASDEPEERQANWWDVFGTLDTSVIPANDGLQTPASRTLFFVATPLFVLLLALTNIATPVAVRPYGTTSLLSFGLALALALPLLAAKTDRAFINAAFHRYLPLVALVVFATAAYSSSAVYRLILNEGIAVFCTLYAVVLCALVLSMPGRMRSLALPCGGFLVLAVNLVVLLTATSSRASEVTSFHTGFSLACFLGAVVLLMTMPGSNMWFGMMDLIPAQPAATTFDAEKTGAPSAGQVVRELAEAHGLTERETQVFALLTRGHSAAYIAERHCVSESTVRTHRGNIYRKFGVASREELIQCYEAYADGK